MTPLALAHKTMEIYTTPYLHDQTGISLDTLSQLKKSTDHTRAAALISMKSYRALDSLLPKYDDMRERAFDFIDLFAGIGGIRSAFENINGRCMFTSEWDKYAVKTYRANYGEHKDHRFVLDIKSVTQPEGKSEYETQEYIREIIPPHDVLLAGFPCQPFSIAGVSKKNSLGKSHGFKCEDQGQLFFDIIRVLNSLSSATRFLPWHSSNREQVRSHKC